MAEYNHNQKGCPHCGAGASELGEMTTSNLGSDSILGADTETSIVAGYVNISSSGLITAADPIGAELLGSSQKALLGRPFTLFVNRDDMVDWFIHRNALFTTHKNQSFEILLCKSDNDGFKAKLDCTYIKDQKQKTDGMRIAIRDYTERRLALDQLEHDHNLNQLITQITADLVRSPTRDIDATVVHELKTLAVFTEVDRVYFGLIDLNNASFTLCHEWCAADSSSIKPPTHSVLLKELPALKGAIETKKEFIFLDAQSIDSDGKTDLKRIHMRETRSYAYFPIVDTSTTALTYRGSVGGVIGYDVVEEGHYWSKAFSHLFQFAGYGLLKALQRKHDETNWLRRYKNAFIKTVHPSNKPKKDDISQPQTIASGQKKATTGSHTPLMIESSTGDMLEVFNMVESVERQAESEWQYEGLKEVGDVTEAQKVRIVDDQVLITCPKCMRQDRPKEDEFKAFGKWVRATCTCQFQFVLQSEMRQFHRKEVNLEGVFVRTQRVNTLSDSMNYSGKAYITNVSKDGIGFLTEGPNNLNTGDKVRIKFTLDNQSRSVISKHVLIKGISDRYAGGQFINANRHDITLGFYLM